MIIVSDTSPITNLIQINKIELLEKIFSEIIITPAVQYELFQIEEQKLIISKLNWIKVIAPSDNKLIQELMLDLDKGEAESIALALEKHADLILIDEQKGRRIAASNGLKIIGLIGIIIKAKQLGLINKVGEILNELILKAGFRVNPELLKEILHIVNE